MTVEPEDPLAISTHHAMQSALLTILAMQGEVDADTVSSVFAGAIAGVVFALADVTGTADLPAMRAALVGSIDTYIVQLTDEAVVQ